MLNNKQDLEFKEPEYQEVVFGKYKIKVKPYLSLADQMALTQVYLEEYFGKEQTRILESEYKLVYGIFDFCTDVNIESMTINGLLSNYKMWEEVKSKIKNYGEFRALLARTVEEVKESKRIEKSLGTVLETLFDRLSGLLSTDISPESIEKVQQLLKDVEESKIFKKATELYKDK